MFSGLVLITPPATEPVSLAEAKQHLRVDITDDDNLITALITAAREYCEGFQNRAYITQTWQLWLDAWPEGSEIRIPRPPLQSVSDIKYYGTDDTEYIFDAANYFVDAKSEPGRVVLKYGKSWPTIMLRPTNGICVTFIAGYKVYQGTVNVEGTTVTRISGDEFNIKWPKQKTIVINNAVYRISSVASGDLLSLVEAAGSQSAVGYEANDVPERIKQAILLLVGHWYDNREIAAAGRLVNEVPFTVNALLWQERVVPV
ncbi:MAG: head-tail connector protein [Desulfotomaculales bacterium]